MPSGTRSTRSTVEGTRLLTLQERIIRALREDNVPLVVTWRIGAGKAAIGS